MPVVHAAAKAVFPLFAGGADAGAGPVVVPEGLEAVLPNFPKAILIDISLRETVPVNVGTGADAAVNEDGGNVHPGVAEMAHGAHLFLVSAQIAFAAEGDGHGPALLPLLPDEFHELHKLLVA